MNFAGMRVWISGANGFVGAALTHALLHQGARVFAGIRAHSDLRRLQAIRDAIEFIPCDLAEADAALQAVARARPEWVFHSVAASWHPSIPAGRSQEFTASALGTFNLCEALRAHPPCGIVHLSTSQEGAAAECAESFAPTSFRGAAKACASLLLAHTARELGARLTVLRLASVYGPWQQPDRAVPSLIRAALAGMPPEITPAPTGRDFIYIDDVVAAALSAVACEAADGTAIAIGSGRVTPILDVARFIYELLELPFPEPREYSSRACDQAFRALPQARAKRLLGWLPAMDLQTGLRLTIDWQRRHENLG